MTAQTTRPARKRRPHATSKPRLAAAPQPVEVADVQPQYPHPAEIPGVQRPHPDIDELTWLYRAQGISPRRQAFDRAVRTTISGTFEWLLRHWLLLVNAVLGLIVGGAFLVPVLYYFGLPNLGRQIFITYHFICEQIPAHSYYLFGYQMALCARNLAIYGSMFVASLAFRFVRRRLPALDWRLWLLLIVPMALDGGTQMFGWRESNWELRTLTGVLFGIACCWVALPTFEALVHPLKPISHPITHDTAWLAPAI